MNGKSVRNKSRFLSSILFGWLYLPHLVMCRGEIRSLVKSDLVRLEHQIGFKLPFSLQLLYHLHNNRYYRTLFYHRIGPVKAALLNWYRPADRYFNISARTTIGKGFWMAHPFGTIINAVSIGDNFSCVHLTTIGSKEIGVDSSVPVIGNNVSVGANATIVGNVKIGDNVMIGAGCVVVKDVPDNCIVAGNPAKVIKMI